MKSSAQITLKKLDDSVKKYVLTYFILTCVCFWLDVINFFRGVALLSGNDYYLWSYSACVLLVVSSVFVTLDVFYIVWVASHKIKLSESVGGLVCQALMGFPSKLLKTFEDPDAHVD